jgi:hypothetical protein
MLSIEDGAVHSAGDSPGEVAVAPVASPSGESVATTEPEQTPEQNAVKVGYVEIVYPKRKWVLVLIPLRGLSNQMFSLVDKQPFWMPYQQIGKNNKLPYFFGFRTRVEIRFIHVLGDGST